MALSRTSSRNSQSGRLYSAATSLRSIDSPDGVNNYLRTILDPAHHSSGIPDDDQTRRVIKHNTISSTIRVPEEDREIMIIYTPKSKGPVINVYVRPTNAGPWGFLTQIDKSDPLYQSYSLARNVAGMIQIYSATLPAGAFSINGSINGVYTTSLPSFADISFDKILSYAAGPAYVSVGDGVVEGQVLLAVPNGKNPYTPPLPPFSQMFDPSTLPLEIGVPNCAVPGGVAVDQKFYSIPGFQTTAHVAPSTVLNTIIDLGTGTNIPLQDPLTGWFKVSVGFQVEATFTYDARVVLRVESYTADPNTWGVGTTYKEYPLGMVKLNNQPFPDIFYSQTFEFLYLPAQVSRVSVYVEYITPVNTTVTFTRRKVTFQNYSIFTEENQPASIAIIQGLDAGTQLKLVGLSIDECVPKADLSRDLTAVPGVDDDLEAEVAEARLGAGDFRMVQNRLTYNNLIMSGAIERMSTGSALYSAASLGKLARKMRGRWDSLTPSQQQSIKDMGQAVGTVANTFTGGALTPFLNMANAFPSYHASSITLEAVSTPPESPTPPNSPQLARMRVLLVSSPHEAWSLVQQFCPKFALQASYGTNVMRVSPGGRVYVAAETQEEAESFLATCLKSKGYSASSRSEEYEFDFPTASETVTRRAPQKPKKQMTMEEEPDDEDFSPEPAPTGPMPTIESIEPLSFSPAVMQRATQTANTSAKNIYMLLPDPSLEMAPVLTAAVARYGRPPKILDYSGDPVPMIWERTAWEKVVFYFPHDYYDKDPSWFLTMTKMAGNAGERGEFYVTNLRELPQFDGDSWKLAWAATIMGISVPNAILTGGVVLDGSNNPITSPITRIEEKLAHCRDQGLKLLFPSSNISDALEGLVADDEKIVTSAYTWRSRPLPPKTVGVAIGCLQDLFLFTKTNPQIVPRSNLSVEGKVVPKVALTEKLEKVITDLEEASSHLDSNAQKNVERMANQLRQSYAAYLKVSKIAKDARTEGQDSQVIQFANLVNKMKMLAESRRAAFGSLTSQKLVKQQKEGAPREVRKDGTIVGNKKTLKTAAQRKRRKERAAEITAAKQSEGTYEFDFS